MTLDPVTLEVLRNALPAISDEMSYDLQRTSYNMMIYEVRDYCTALVTPEGELVSQNMGGVSHFVADLGVLITDGMARYGRDGFKLGDVINVDKIFAVGDKISVTGTSKGKGFQGVVKRHHFGGGAVTHGQSDRLRAPGSVGSSSYPSRVFKGLRMAGRMGGKRSTMKNLKVVRLIPDSNLILVEGSVPGPTNGYVQIWK